MNPLIEYQRLLAIAQSGKKFGRDHFDQERYAELERISLALISQLGNKPIAQITDLFSGETGYQTPKVDVRAFCQNAQNEILLVEDRQTKEWSLPGGFAEIGMSPRENLAKELIEETGFEAHIGDLLAIFDTNQKGNPPQSFQYYKLVFACELLRGEFIANQEIRNIGFFSIEQLPPLSTKRTTKEQLTILRQSRHSPHVD